MSFHAALQLAGFPSRCLPHSDRLAIKALLTCRMLLQRPRSLGSFKYLAACASSRRVCRLLQDRDCSNLQDVDDAKVEHRVLRAPGVLRVQGHSCGCHVHAQVHPRLPKRVGQLVCGAMTEC